MVQTSAKTRTVYALVQFASRQGSHDLPQEPRWDQRWLISDTRKVLRHDLADSAPDPILRQLNFHQPQSAADATCIGIQVANCAFNWHWNFNHWLSNFLLALLKLLSRIQNWVTSTWQVKIDCSTQKRGIVSSWFNIQQLIQHLDNEKERLYTRTFQQHAPCLKLSWNSPFWLIACQSDW